MTTGFGMAPDRNGNGTTPDDLQAVIAAQYPEPGIISGCEVKGTAAMSYSVGAGAVCIHLAPGRAVLAPGPGERARRWGPSWATRLPGTTTLRERSDGGAIDTPGRIGRPR